MIIPAHINASLPHDSFTLRITEGFEVNIASAPTLSALREIRIKLQNTSMGHIGAPLSLARLAELNDMHDAIIRRTAALCEQAMIRDGFGRPPTAYGVVLFGSGGRREQTPWSDQDNGLIYEQARDSRGGDHTDYFTRFGARLVQALREVAYLPCDGKVTADHALWCKSFSDWATMLRGWLEEAGFEQIRYVLICADGRTIYGNEQLYRKIWQTVLDYMAAHPAILHRMAANTLHRKVMLNLFGQFIPEPYGENAGGVDLKYGVYLPLVNGIRQLAMEHRITVPGTLDRMRQLQAIQVLTHKQYQDWAEAFERVLQLRSAIRYRLENGAFIGETVLRISDLNRSELSMLKQAIRSGRQMQKYMRQRYH